VIFNTIIKELSTPSGQMGPASDAYLRAVVAGGHALLGAAICAWFGWWGLAVAVPLAVAYWWVKERGDLLRGGAFWDGLEDTVMVSIGAWYGVVWWPLVVLCCMGYIMAASIVRGHRD
jgi:hypothetical protein